MVAHDLLKDDDWNIVSETCTVTRYYLVKGDNPIDSVKQRDIRAAYIEHNDLVDDTQAEYKSKPLSDKDRSDSALVRYARWIMEDISPEPEPEPVKRRRKRRKSSEQTLTPRAESATIDLSQLADDLGLEKV